ncbi:hypothetical protein E2C01_082086 [Portunus trituberculatus]|uniref:Uncharacterized protein n=1 Tax=Portunus trituberculatus TaxID=210409 RepID=A0A5B7IY47_PORTR|nr:hypothetical protein [Portunus trituberculatus]
MCWVIGPQPFGLPVSDANYHHSYRSSEDEGQAGLLFSTQDRPHHKKPDLRHRVSQEAQQKLLELP